MKLFPCAIARARLRSTLFLVVTLISLAGLESPANAIPAFARRYKLLCGSCHSHYPELNTYGRAFLRNNFQLPGQPASTLKDIGLPLSAEWLGGTEITHRETEDNWELQGLAGGAVSKSDSFYVHHHLLANGRRGDLYEAWAQHKFGRGVNIRAGQFELPFGISPEIERLSHSEYLIFLSTIGHNNSPLGAPALGVQLSTGGPGDGFHLFASIHRAGRASHSHGGSSGANGHDGDDDDEDHGHEEGLLRTRQADDEPTVDRQFGDFMARAEWLNGETRVGFFGYSGRADIVGDTFRRQDQFNRMGIDAEHRMGRWRFYGLWLTGENTDPAGEGERGSLNGGFVGGDVHVGNSSVIYSRYERVHARGPETSGLLRRILLGAKTHLHDNFVIGGELSRNQNHETTVGLFGHVVF
jgi:hypothetical protein